MIPLIKLPLNEDDAQAVADVVRSKQIGLGNLVFEFEQMLAKYIGAKYVVALDSCTSALFLSVKYHEMCGGDKEISIPSMTVPLAANAIMEAGCQVKFNDDVDWVGTTYNLIGTNIWDSAHELYRDCFKKYSAGSTVCFSFYPTKPIGSADGGAIATNDKRFADWVRSISCYGRNQSTKYQDSWEYDIDMIGYKRHYTNLQAALCMSQLKRLDETNKKREIIRDFYNEMFGLKNKSHYLYRINVKDRREFIAKMKQKGIACGVHYKPMHMMKAYKSHPVKNAKKIEKAYEHTVSIPYFAYIQGWQGCKVAEHVEEHLL